MFCVLPASLQVYGGVGGAEASAVLIITLLLFHWFSSKEAGLDSLTKTGWQITSSSILKSLKEAVAQRDAEGELDHNLLK